MSLEASPTDPAQLPQLARLGYKVKFALKDTASCSWSTRPDPGHPVERRRSPPTARSA